MADERMMFGECKIIKNVMYNKKISRIYDETKLYYYLKSDSNERKIQFKKISSLLFI